MKKSLLLLCSVLGFAMASCGGGSQTMNTMTPAFSAAPMNGTFSLMGLSAIAGTNVLFLDGQITTDPAGNMSGTLGVATNSAISTCFPVGSSATFTGMRDATGGFMLTGSAIAGQVITITQTVGSTASSINLTYAVTGGCMTGDHGRIALFNLLSGTFTGSFFAGGSPVNVTITFGAPGPPQANGMFPLNATATFTNTSGCGGFTTAATTAANQSGESAGVTLMTNTGAVIDFNGSTIDSLAVMFSGGFTVSGTSSCSGTTGAFTVKKA